MLFVINYNSEIQCTPPQFPTATSLLTHPQLCLVFIFLCHILPPHRAILLGFFSPSLSFFFFLSEVGVKSLKYRVQGGPEGNKHRPGFVYSAPEENGVSGF